MKIRNKDRKINIEKIFIQQYENRSIATLIINGQSIDIMIPAVYITDVFAYIEKYLQTIGSDNEYVRI